MKASAELMAAIVFASVTAQGQGQFLFNTHDVTTGHVGDLTDARTPPLALKRQAIVGVSLRDESERNNSSKPRDRPDGASIAGTADLLLALPGFGFPSDSALESRIWFSLSESSTHSVSPSSMCLQVHNLFSHSHPARLA